MASAQQASNGSLEQQIQTALGAVGFDAGPADGQFGPKTRRAIAAWQRAYGHDATGFLSADQITELLAVAQPGAKADSALPATDDIGQGCIMQASGLEFDWSGRCRNGIAVGAGTATGHGTTGRGEAINGFAHGWHTGAHDDGTTFRSLYDHGELVRGTLTRPDGSTVQVP